MQIQATSHKHLWALESVVLFSRTITELYLSQEERKRPAIGQFIETAVITGLVPRAIPSSN